MKKISGFFAVIFMTVALNFNAQITGTKTITIDYPTIAAAVATLNTVGVGVGGATIYIPANYTETLSTQLVLTMNTNPSSIVRPLLFAKLGAGNNPVLTAFSPGISATLDGIFILNGADYVTIDGLDLMENAANTNATQQMEWGYALLKSSTINGAQNNTIKNCNVTLNKSNTGSVGIYMGNHTPLSITTLVISTVGGTSSNNKFFNNSLQNIYTGYFFTGYGSAAPYDFYDQNNQIGVDGVSTKRSQIVNFGGGALTANGVSATNQNNIKIFSTYINNSGGAPTTAALNGILLNTGTNSNVDIYGDTLTLSLGSTGSALVGINNGMGNTGAGNTVNIYNCVIDGCTYATATSGLFRGIQQAAAASYCNIYNNRISNNTLPGTGEFSGIYYSGGSLTLVLSLNINNNVISNNTKTGTGGPFYGINANVATYATNTFSNQVFNNNNSTSSGATYGYYNFSIVSGAIENLYDNQFYNITGGSGETIALFAQSGAGTTNKYVNNNTIYNISGNAPAAQVGAIAVQYGLISDIYKNNIYNITNSTTTGPVPAAYGINVAAGNNIQINTHNNYVSEIKAPNASNANAVYGIWLQGSASSYLNAYYNTVYLNATSVGANFGSAAMACASAPQSIDLRNNILVNASTPAGTGTTKALVRGSNVLSNYHLSSGYNCLHAGTPGPANLIFFDGINSVQTLQAFKNLVGPREQSSFSSVPPFINVATSPYNLHIQTGVPTQCESGAAVIAGLTTDFDGNLRNVSTPDVGADEFSGITTDIAAPNIQYIPLTNAGVAPARNAPAFATITDPSGINVIPGTKPRLYYKKSTHANTYISNVNTDDCWKFVEATNASSPFDFNINYTLLFGGGVSADDVIQYFVVAQDLAGTPIVGLNNGGFAVQPSNVALSAINFPLGNTINQYTIVSNVYSGTLLVGPTETITSLTNPGGVFNLINNGSLSGNLTISITGDLTGETGTHPLNQWAEEGAGNYSVSIVPNAAVNRNIVGSNAALSLVRFDGADRVNIDGRFGGSGTFLTFRNTSNTAPGIGYFNDAQNNILQYAIIESGNTAITATAGGAVLIGTTTALYGNDNNTITACEVRDRSDIPGTPAIGINCSGTSTGVVTQYNNNCVITNNNVHDWFLQNSATTGILAGAGSSGFNISGNSLYQTVPRVNTLSGALMRGILVSFASPVASNGGFTVNNNYVGGTAPLASGNDMTLTVSGASIYHTFAGIILTSGLIPNSVQGNVVRKVDFTTQGPTAAASVWIGIQAAQGVYSIGTQTGNIIGAGTGNDINKITINAGGSLSAFIAGILAAPVNGYMDIRNNVIGGITIGGNNTLAATIPQWIQLQGTPLQTSTVSNNFVGSSTTSNSIQHNSSAPIVSFGFRQVITSGAGLALTSNTFQNITDNSPSTGSGNYGILCTSTSGNSGTMNITGNVLRNLSSNTLPPGAVLSNMGMAFQNMAGTSHTIESNIISGIVNTNTGSGGSYAIGIQSQGNTFGGYMNRNYINNIRNNNTGAAPGVEGIYFSTGLNWNVTNNMISINNGTNTNNVDMNGIVDFMGQNANCSFHYNSIYLGGTVSVGATNTSPYLRPGNSTPVLRNNLFYNERAGGTGSHVAISSSGQSGWNNATSNYNAFVVSDTSRIGIFSGVAYNLTNFKTNSGGDFNSNKSINTIVTPAALFINHPTGDLHINTSVYPGGLATPITTTIDIDVNPRSPNFPAVGADEIPCPAPIVSVLSQTNLLCFGGNNGAAEVTATGGATHTYSWIPTGGTLSIATNLNAGTYTVNVTNNCNITTTIAVNITQPASINPIVTQTNVSCNTGSNGAISLSVTGGTSPYTYSWSPGGQTVSAISNLPAGNYTFVITDNNTCTVTNSVTITQPATLIATGTASSACSSQSTGVITVSVSGGTPSYTYNWTPNVSITNTASNLPAGNYSVLVTDQNSCTAMQTFTVGSIPSPSITGVTNTFACSSGSNGAISLTVTGGTPGYTYSWTPNVSGTNTAINLAGGTYSFAAIDQNSCAARQVFTVNTIPSPTLSIQPSTTIVCEGERVTFTVSGANTYSWSTGATVTIVSPTPTGTGVTTYSVVGTGTNGCKSEETVSVSVISCVGIKENNGDNIMLTIYPNPGTGVYRIHAGNELMGTQIEVYNSIGQLIRTKEIKETDTKLDITSEANGIYFVRLISDGNVMGSTKIIKE